MPTGGSDRRSLRVALSRVAGPRSWFPAFSIEPGRGHGRVAMRRSVAGSSSRVSSRARRSVGVLAAAAVVSTLSGGAANAALSSVGPTDPSVGFPSFYGDSTGAKLQLCIRAGDPCLAGTTVTGSPSTPANITPETFYFVADADMPPLPGLPASSIKYRASVEAALGAGPAAAGDQITFSRINIVGKGLAPNTTYTFTHPYGTATATTDVKGNLKFRDEAGCPAPGPGIGPCDFSIANLGQVGPFLKWNPAVAPVAPQGYLGDALTAHPVVG